MTALAMRGLVGYAPKPPLPDPDTVKLVLAFFAVILSGAGVAHYLLRAFGG